MPGSRLEEARKLDAQVLIEKFVIYWYRFGLDGIKMWSPVIDGKVQTGHFSEMIIRTKAYGSFNDEQYIY